MAEESAKQPQTHDNKESNQPNQSESPSDQTPNDYVTERVRYFDGQFLQSQDFKDEQNYHVSRQTLANRLLRVSGICEGFEIEHGSTQNLLTIKPGVAINNRGKFIIQKQSIEITFAQNAKEIRVYADLKNQAKERVDNQKDYDYKTSYKSGEKGAIRIEEKMIMIIVNKPYKARGNNNYSEVVFTDSERNYPECVLLRKVILKDGFVKSIESHYSGIYLPCGGGMKGEKRITLKSEGEREVTLTGGLTIQGGLEVTPIKYDSLDIDDKEGGTEFTIGAKEVKIKGELNILGKLTVKSLQYESPKEEWKEKKINDEINLENDAITVSGNVELRGGLKVTTLQFHSPSPTTKINRIDNEITESAVEALPTVHAVISYLDHRTPVVEKRIRLGDKGELISEITPPSSKIDYLIPCKLFWNERIVIKHEKNQKFAVIGNELPKKIEVKEEKETETKIFSLPDNALEICYLGVRLNKLIEEIKRKCDEYRSTFYENLTVQKLEQDMTALLHGVSIHYYEWGRGKGDEVVIKEYEGKRSIEEIAVARPNTWSREEKIYIKSEEEDPKTGTITLQLRSNEKNEELPFLIYPAAYYSIKPSQRMIGLADMIKKGHYIPFILIKIENL